MTNSCFESAFSFEFDSKVPMGIIGLIFWVKWLEITHVFYNFIFI